MTRISSAAYVTAVLQFLQAFNRGDLDACERLLEPRVEWHSAVSYSGRGEVRAMLQSFSERFSIPQARPDDFRVAAGHVLMIVCLHEGDPEAARAEQRQSWLVEISEEGLIKRVLSYQSPGDAVRALEALAAAAPKVPA